MKIECPLWPCNDPALSDESSSEVVEGQTLHFGKKTTTVKRIDGSTVIDKIDAWYARHEGGRTYAVCGYATCSMTDKLENTKPEMVKEIIDERLKNEKRFMVGLVLSKNAKSFPDRRLQPSAM